MSRFIRPDVRTLTISDGDTLVVRARLTAGEYRAMLARLYVVGPENTVQRNLMQMQLANVTAYLLDWSLRDEQGHTVPIRDLPIADLEHTLNQLSPEALDEIHTAITAHVAAMTAEMTAQKKTQAGDQMSLMTSSSPPGSAGVTNGSGTSTQMSMRS